MRILQLREVEKLAQGHTTPAALEWQPVQSDCVGTLNHSVLLSSK